MEKCGTIPYMKVSGDTHVMDESSLFPLVVNGIRMQIMPVWCKGVAARGSVDV